MEGLQLRPAARADLGAINAIYNYYVLHSTCTYQTQPSTEEERAAWFDEHGKAHPVIVAERDGDVLGWGSLSRFHPRAAYGRTVENSVYVRHDALGKGIGTVLLRELIALAKKIGHHTIVAGISADQAPSVELHRRAGFVQAANLREVGFKFERWLDVVYMQLMLDKS